ncbi:MbtH family NRPS accessory protein [Photorhabdus bodei]|uniref:MbtH family NRPS accessory protein n=1 Tax=Photorhabdus bodei TaxID=2029681 RepID=A0A329X7C6_9GAMM|nr:MbtH family NRPS accessory protein [Photorhabdus bodei]NDL04407.1 MbtH family NRPS accessory protein [Photorhabdus bodei]NDL08778.1 MbtH family NRPS accessory protein [Photorhabdus bodei]RAX11870.1 MbtH family protein [Photorhabdus bodei]
MSNPFENEFLDFFVLINDENQHSLWPVFIAVPAGWQVIYGPEKRENCLSFVESNWKDMRLKSLQGNKLEKADQIN